MRVLVSELCASIAIFTLACLTLVFAVAPEILVPNQLLGYQFGARVVAECLVEAYPNTINYWMKHQTEMLLNK